jgi:hypothetical protein
MSTTNTQAPATVEQRVANSKVIKAIGLLIKAGTISAGCLYRHKDDESVIMIDLDKAGFEETDTASQFDDDVYLKVCKHDNHLSVFTDKRYTGIANLKYFERQETTIDDAFDMLKSIKTEANSNVTVSKPKVKAAANPSADDLPF